MTPYTIDWAFQCAYEIFYDEGIPEQVMHLLTTKSDVMLAHVIADPVEAMAEQIRLHCEAMLRKEKRHNTISVVLSTEDVSRKLRECSEEMDRKGNTGGALIALELAEALAGTAPHVAGNGHG